ncbi:universal stress protein [Salinigranum halophilum]|uniref:universal stress protein n=1 Tax=Salinigranum halophilum TaxID=2565931 RepID=UPI0010A936E2|nr:universal stress protein [Salinigranum halophilum]
MYRVLLAVSDDDGQAREQADFVASLPGTDELDVTVTHAYDESGERDPHGDPLPPEESTGVQAARARLAEAGLTVETRETYQPVAEGIVDLAADIDADLVVVGARKRTPIGKAVFGSVTQSVVLDSPVPVTVVGVE